MAFQDVSYQKHAEQFAQELKDEKRIARSETWLKTDTADYWRHARMYEAVDFLTSDPADKWLTIGDGRLGLDAIRLRERGAQDVLASDISDTLLKKSREQGHIAKYAVENAESLSFSNDEFDYVFCKESYHHFPRPGLALYEMLRVARKAVVLIEPNDPDRILLRRIKHLIKTVLRGKSHVDAGFYEESGNYIYSISKREMEKVALGLNLPLLITKGLNDHYIDGCEFEPAQWTSPIYRRIRVKCALKDVFARTFLYDHNLLMVVLFKQAPGEDVISRFRHHRWNVVWLPRNPYAS